MRKLGVPALRKVCAGMTRASCSLAVWLVRGGHAAPRFTPRLESELNHSHAKNSVQKAQAPIPPT